MINNFIKTIERHRILEKGDGVVVGVSGGPDSICLLHLLWCIQKEYNLTLYAVHLNHQFRGIDSDGDASYVKEFHENSDTAVLFQLLHPSFSVTMHIQQHFQYK